MKKTVVTLSLLALALTGCSSGAEQSGGSSNPDSQVEQPPLPGQTDPRSQGPAPSGEADDSSDDTDQDTDQESDGDDDEDDVGATPGATG